MPYRFGPFFVDPQREQISRDGETIDVNRKAVQLLVALIERQGELVTKEEIVSSVWSDRGATMNNVSQHVFMLRTALGDSAQTHKYILTVPRFGYRFVAPVVREDGDAAKSIIARHYCENARYLRRMRTRHSIESAIGLYERALHADPESADAHAGLSICRFWLAEYMFEPQLPMLDLAQRNAERAMELDPQNVTALTMLAKIAAELRYEWRYAETLLLRALRLDPNYLWAYEALIRNYLIERRFMDAWQTISNAESFVKRDDPFPRLPLLRAALHYYSGAPEAAAEIQADLVNQHPKYGLARLALAKSLLAGGDWEQAQTHAEAILNEEYDPMRPGQPNVRERAKALRVLIRSAAGDAGGAKELALRMEAGADGAAISKYCVAIAALGAGSLDRAMRFLEAAVASRDPLVARAVIEPHLAPLRELRTWPRLLAGLNLRP